MGPVKLLILQGTTKCNLNCSYCYIKQSARKTGATMSLETVATVFNRLVASDLIGKELECIWHSGEPLVLPVSYYRDAVARIEQILENAGSKCRVRFGFQTNATLINDQWTEFWNDLAKRDRLHLGVSCDGPPSFHDEYRRNWGGRGSHAATLRGLRLINRAGISCDLIVVLGKPALKDPDGLYDFLHDHRALFDQVRFNLPDDFDVRGTLDSVTATKLYGPFLKRWIERIDIDGSEAIIPRNFTEFYARLRRFGNDIHPIGIRAFEAINVDSNGDISTFHAGLTGDQHADLYGDHKGLIIGNIAEDNFDAMKTSSKFSNIQRDFVAGENACHQRCGLYSVCPSGYALVKHRRYGRFDADETPECRVQVQTLAEHLLSAIEQD
ncbi:radical SAM protein [Parasphingorhabdus sp.]|uniref:radical SAM protein n=1 Tax=Parasphingorhabdus sp. TaxID=2709688 RepID=UPI003A91E43A